MTTTHVTGSTLTGGLVQSILQSQSDSLKLYFDEQGYTTISADSVANFRSVPC